jgi:hypothetical protein
VTVSNLVVSNPFGLLEKRYLMGARVDLALPISTINAGQTLNVTAVTLDDQLQVTLLGIPDAVPDIDKLAQYVREALDSLQGALSAPAGSADAPVKRTTRARAAPAARPQPDTACLRGVLWSASTRRVVESIWETLMEKQFSVPVDKVFALLTDPKWLEARCLSLGELSARCKTKKSEGAVTVTMKRRVRRELNAVISKVLNPDSDIELQEQWTVEKNRRVGTFTLQIIGKPITVTADFELAPEGKGCVYRIQHRANVRVPLIGGVVEKFLLGQVQQGCADELDYLADYLKKNK